MPDRFLATVIACTFFGGSAQLSCALIFNARGYVFVEQYRVIFVLVSRKMNSLMHHFLLRKETVFSSQSKTVTFLTSIHRS